MSEPNIKTYIIKKKKKSKYNSLYEFLGHVKVSRGSEYTHTSMSKGSYFINNKKRKMLLFLILWYWLVIHQ